MRLNGAPWQGGQQVSAHFLHNFADVYSEFLKAHGCIARLDCGTSPSFLGMWHINQSSKQLSPPCLCLLVGIASSMLVMQLKAGAVPH